MKIAIIPISEAGREIASTLKRELKAMGTSTTNTCESRKDI
jgi:hypothetical protein